MSDNYLTIESFKQIFLFVPVRHCKQHITPILKAVASFKIVVWGGQKMSRLFKRAAADANSTGDDTPSPAADANPVTADVPAQSATEGSESIEEKLPPALQNIYNASRFKVYIYNFYILYGGRYFR